MSFADPSYLIQSLSNRVLQALVPAPLLSLPCGSSIHLHIRVYTCTQMKVKAISLDQISILNSTTAYLTSLGYLINPSNSIICLNLNTLSSLQTGSSQYSLSEWHDHTFNYASQNPLPWSPSISLSPAIANP